MASPPIVGFGVSVRMPCCSLSPSSGCRGELSPAFNVADSALMVGVALFLLGDLRKKLRSVECAPTLIPGELQP